MDSYVVVGYVGDPPVEQSFSLVHRRPVLMADDQTIFVPLRDNWRHNDLVRLGPGDREYVTSLEEGAPLQGSEGDCIWIATAPFIGRCGRFNALEPISELFLQWPGRLAGSGSRYKLGGRVEFDEFSSRVFGLAKRAYFGALVRDRTDFIASFEIIDSLHYGPPAEQYVLRALFFWEMLDKDRYDAVCNSAVVRGFAATRSEFELEVEKLREWLSRPRISPASSSAEAISNAQTWVARNREELEARDEVFDEFDDLVRDLRDEIGTL